MQERPTIAPLAKPPERGLRSSAAPSETPTRRRRRGAARLRLGHWLPAILTGALTLAIPALYVSALRTAEKTKAREAAIHAQAAAIGPACAADLSQDLCLCADFETRDQAEAYVAALTALGRPPKRRFGLYTDASDRPCAHLPEQ